MSGFWACRHNSTLEAAFLRPRPLGVQHFYDAFAVNAETKIRSAAIDSSVLREEEITSGLRVIPAASPAHSSPSANCSPFVLTFSLSLSAFGTFSLLRAVPFILIG